MSLKKNVLHVSTDNKFIEGAKNTFKSIFDKNTFLILKSPFIRLKFAKKDDLTTIKNYHSFIYCLNDNFDEYDYIIIHDMNYFNSRLVLSKPTLDFIYLGWGYEIYNNAYILNNFPAMLKHSKLPKLQKGFLNSRFINLIKYGIYSDSYNNQKLVFEAINKIKRIGLLENEFKFFKELNILNSECKLLPSFLYYPSSKIYDLEKNSIEKSNSLIIGNSSARGIGHINLFETIIKLKLSKVIVPLSYGDDKYRDEVIGKGYSLLGEKFEPILNYISLSNYSEYFKNSICYLDNSSRQRAFGNIMLCLEYGVKIFLNPVNPVFLFIKNKGGYVWPIKEISNQNISMMTYDQQEANRLIVKKFFLKEKIITNWIKEFSL